MEILSGNRAAGPRLHDLTVALGGPLLALVGGPKAKAANASAPRWIRATRWTASPDGRRPRRPPRHMAEDWRTHLPKAPLIGDVVARESGHVTAFDGEALGLAVVAMGGGRRVETDKIDPAVGLTDVVRLGQKIEKGQPLATIHARDETGPPPNRPRWPCRPQSASGPVPQMPLLIRERVG